MIFEFDIILRPVTADFLPKEDSINNSKGYIKIKIQVTHLCSKSSFLIKYDFSSIFL